LTKMRQSRGAALGGCQLNVNPKRTHALRYATIKKKTMLTVEAEGKGRYKKKESLGHRKRGTTPLHSVENQVSERGFRQKKKLHDGPAERSEKAWEILGQETGARDMALKG